MVATRLFLISFLSLAGCATAPALRTKSDPPIDLASFRTYQWRDPTPESATALSDRARAAVARRLGARGLAGAARGAIAVSVSMDAGLNKHAADFEGDLIIAIYDARSQSLFWSGNAAGPVDPESDADIDRLVEALLVRATGSSQQH